ncbi:MAG: hypothetical protein ACOCU7_02575 [Tangfeifania sp.]
MKKRFLSILMLLLFVGGLVPAVAQENAVAEQSVVKTYGFYAGGQASTNGLGLNIKYIANKNFTFKAGYETLALNHAFAFSEKDMDYAANLDYTSGGLFLLADWFYTKNLYISGGAIVNKFQPYLSGYATSDLQYGDITIPASDVGDFSIYFEPELKTSPYMAVGFRKFLGKRKRVSYNFETGLYYLGSPEVTIETTGLLKPTSDEVHGKEAYLEKHFSVYKYYPIAKFDIAVKLF